MSANNISKARRVQVLDSVRYCGRFDPRETAFIGSGPAIDLKDVPQSVAVIPGHGIGPGIIEASLEVLDCACPGLDWVYLDVPEIQPDGAQGNRLIDVFETIESIGVVLKGPTEPYSANGMSGLSRTLRTEFDLYASVRSAKSLPGWPVTGSGGPIDVLIVRENLDLPEHGLFSIPRLMNDEALPLVTRFGSLRVSRLAFELASMDGRDTVHCVSNTAGFPLASKLLSGGFDATAQDYFSIAGEHLTINECANELIADPDRFSVIVTANVAGDFIGDLAVGLAGGMHLVPAAQIGSNVAVFEPLHGSADTTCRADCANPTAMILSGAWMLRHLGYAEEAERVERAIRHMFAERAAPDLFAPHLGNGMTVARFTHQLMSHLTDIPPSPPEPRSSGLFLQAPGTFGQALAQPVRQYTDLFVIWTAGAEGLAEALVAALSGSHHELLFVTRLNASASAEIAAVPGTPVWQCRFMHLGMDDHPAAVQDALVRRLPNSIPCLGGQGCGSQLRQLHEPPPSNHPFNGYPARESWSN